MSSSLRININGLKIALPLKILQMVIGAACFGVMINYSTYRIPIDLLDTPDAIDRYKAGYFPGGSFFLLVSFAAFFQTFLEILSFLENSDTRERAFMAIVSCLLEFLLYFAACLALCVEVFDMYKEKFPYHEAFLAAVILGFINTTLYGVSSSLAILTFERRWRIPN